MISTLIRISRKYAYSLILTIKEQEKTRLKMPLPEQKTTFKMNMSQRTNLIPISVQKQIDFCIQTFQLIDEHTRKRNKRIMNTWVQAHT